MKKDSDPHWFMLVPAPGPVVFTEKGGPWQGAGVGPNSLPRGWVALS